MKKWHAYFFLATNDANKQEFFLAPICAIQKENSGSVITALELMLLDKLDIENEVGVVGVVELNKTQVADPPRNTSRNKACCCSDGTQCSENRKIVQNYKCANNCTQACRVYDFSELYTHELGLTQQ